jgi:hypothetical protein
MSSQPDKLSTFNGMFKKMRSFLAKLQFNFISVLLILVVTPSVYAFLNLAVSINLFDLINKFPTEVKELISINMFWLELFIGTTMPIFLSLALSIQLAKLKPDDAATIKNILPWIFPLRKFFFSKLPILLVLTAAVFLGIVLFLTFGSDVDLYGNLFLLIFPIFIFSLGVMIKEILAEDPIQGRVGQYMLKNPRAFTALFLVLASASWIYTEMWLPISNRWDLIIFFKSSII